MTRGLSSAKKSPGVASEIAGRLHPAVSTMASVASVIDERSVRRRLNDPPLCAALRIDEGGGDGKSIRAWWRRPKDCCGRLLADEIGVEIAKTKKIIPLAKM